MTVSFLQTEILNLGEVNAAKAFAIAFIAGFSERLVVEVVQGVAREDQAK